MSGGTPASAPGRAAPGPAVVHPVRVIYADTDTMGVVYYANYLRYFEAARGAFLRERGRGYAEIERAGLAFPVVEAHCAYLAPARYDDLLHVRAEVTGVGRASFRFDYRVTRPPPGGSAGADAGTVIAAGWTRHVCLGASGRATRIPDDLRPLLGG